MASVWLAAVLPANQSPGLKIFLNDMNFGIDFFNIASPPGIILYGGNMSPCTGSRINSYYERIASPSPVWNAGTLLNYDKMGNSSVYLNQFGMQFTTHMQMESVDSLNT